MTPDALRRAVRAWWIREGVRRDVLDVSSIARQPWARPWTEAQIARALFDLLGWIIGEGDCPHCECSGYLADPTARTVAERPCEVCYARWDLGDDWRGPRVVVGGVECCPACEADLAMTGDEGACGCGHEPRGESLERLLRMSVAEAANDAAAAAE